MATDSYCEVPKVNEPKQMMILRRIEQSPENSSVRIESCDFLFSLVVAKGTYVKDGISSYHVCNR